MVGPLSVKHLCMNWYRYHNHMISVCLNSLHRQLYRFWTLLTKESEFRNEYWLAKAIKKGFELEIVY